MQIEGKNAVGAALMGKQTIEKIYIQNNINSPELIRKIKESGFQYQFIDKNALDRMSKQKNHQGFIAAVSSFKYYSLDDIINEGYKKGNQPLLLILDGVEDPHNLGNILRTAECMGVDGVIIPKNRAADVNDTVIRVSAGAAGFIKVCKVTNINQEIERLKSVGFWIYAAEAGGVDISHTNMKGPIAVVLGGENTGVKQLTSKLCDGIVSIITSGKTPSLNVGSAAAMVLYEINRQRAIK